MMNKLVISLMFILSTLNSDFIRNDENNIIIDTSTNLIWQDSVNSNIKEIADANSSCANLEVGTLKEWRLPSYNELYSLIDLKKSDAKIDDTFKNVKKAEYWTSTKIVVDHNGSTNGNWAISFANGHDARDMFSTFTRCVHYY